MIEQKSLRVFQFSVFFLSVQWIVFGSLHFTLMEATEAQIPNVFSDYSTAIAVATGMIEVAIGILLLVSKTRKWAAVGSLVLLFLFLPSIYRMLHVDDAIRLSTELRNLVRVLLVPNHVLMALCAIYLIQWPLRPVATTERQSGHAPFAFYGNGVIVVAVIMLIANVAGFVGLMVSPHHNATATLWALMCLAVGGLLGFLFGVPRVGVREIDSSSHRPNSNIEVVSDWLTKIIVGVGLLQFRAIGEFLERLATDLGSSLPMGAAGGGKQFATAVIIYFFVAGAIQGYLLTRMYLAVQFEGREIRTGPSILSPARADEPLL